MASVTFTVSTALAQELNEMAQDNGFANAKEMVISFVKRELAHRRAVKRLNAEQQTEIQMLEGQIT